MAELYIEDALKAVAEAERERVVSLVQTQISKLRGRSNTYSSNAANQLQEVIDILRREDDALTPQIVPEEELDRW